MAGGLQFTVDQRALKAVMKAIRQEEDSKQLRKDLVGDIKDALTPLQEKVRASILSMESGGLGHEGGGLEEAIAEKIVIEVRTGGRATGAGLKAKRKGMPRGFEHAPRRTNAKKWRHPVYPRVTSGGVAVDVWVDQVGKPRWFDDTIRDNRTEFTEHIRAAIVKMARRLASRSH